MSRSLYVGLVGVVLGMVTAPLSYCSRSDRIPTWRSPPDSPWWAGPASACWYRAPPSSRSTARHPRDLGAVAFVLAWFVRGAPLRDAPGPTVSSDPTPTALEENHVR
ncbi:hypothetical protein AB0J86_03130 [Micromonospora sp. NPDC049559]|uniref:hypothetical protein n=1 Tax=Micromonospora sp. NPDC049559 TaxID=3155923 RepID=UPI003423B4EE